MIFTLLTTLTAAALQPFVKVKMQAPALFHVTSCEDVTGSQRNSKVAAALNLQQGETFFATLCNSSNPGLLKQKSLNLGAFKQNGNVIQSRSLSYPVDQKLDQIQVIDTTPFAYLLMPLVFAVCIHFLSKTPGKALMRLELAPADPDKKTLTSLLCREYLRLSPLVAFGIIGAIALLSGAATASAEEFAKAASANSPLLLWAFLLFAVGALLFIPHLVSLARWRGRMFYDAIFGFEVRKH